MKRCKSEWMLSTVTSTLSLLFQLSYKAVNLWKSVGYTSGLTRIAAGSKHHWQWYVQFVWHHGCQWHRGRRVFTYTRRWRRQKHHARTSATADMNANMQSNLWEQAVCMMTLAFRLRTSKLLQGTMGSGVPSVLWHRGYNWCSEVLRWLLGQLGTMVATQTFLVNAEVAAWTVLPETTIGNDLTEEHQTPMEADSSEWTQG